MFQRTPLDAMIADQMSNLAGEFPEHEEIEQEQMRLLRALIKYASKNSAFYRRQLKDINPESLQKRTDLRLLPFTSRENIRDHGPEMICVSDDDIARIITIQSSGTTGNPKRLYFTEEDLRLTYNFFRKGMTTMVSPGDKVVILLPGDTPDSTGDILKRALEDQGIAAKAFGLAPAPFATIELLAKEAPQCIVGFPIQLLAALRVDTEKKIPAEKLKSILLCSDYIPEVVIHEIESAWDCENFIHYGTVETGLGGGVECAAHNGTHLRENDLLFEIINPQTGELLPPGDEGEIVVTTLTRKGMPLIRYRTGDIAALLEERCQCGSCLRRLSKVRGRFENKCKLASGIEIHMSSFDEILFNLPDIVDFSIKMTDDTKNETIHIEISTTQGSEQKCARLVYENLNKLEMFNRTKLDIHCKPVSKISPAKRIIQDNRQGLLI